MEYIDDGNGHWRIKYKASGTLTVAQGAAIDIFLVGAGGGGNYGGGGGGLTTNVTNYTLGSGTYSIVIGAGGSGCVTPYTTAGSNGGQTTAFGYSANGGNGAPANSIYGGNGGSAGGKLNSGGTPGENGASNGASTVNATGQGTTTKEFGVSTATAYGPGGGGGENDNSADGGTGGATGGGHELPPSPARLPSDPARFGAPRNPWWAGCTAARLSAQQRSGKAAYRQAMSSTIFSCIA